MKYKYSNLVNLCIFFVFILCLQSVFSQDFFSSPNEDILPETPGGIGFARGSRSYSFIQANKKKKKKKNLRKRPKLDPAKIYQEGWLSISSSTYRNTNRFPPIIFEDGSEIVIKVNEKNFRENVLYNKKNKKLIPGPLYFWFRLSGRHLYYSLKNKDINILDNIYISKISYAFPLDSFSKNAKCFYLKDVRRTKYVLCAQTLTLRNKWICQIQANLGQPQDPICKIKKKTAKGKKGALGKAGLAGSGEEVPSDEKIFEKTITQPLIIIPQPSKMCNEKWDYSNKGKDWECVCGEGKQQSPINLPPFDQAIASAVKPVFEYDEFDPISPSDFKDGLVKSGKPIKIRYLNHAIRIFHPNMGKAITLDGAVYVAEEIVFHTPAEHTINGIRYDLEMQIIHRGVTSGDIAKSVILALLFKKKAGAYNKFIDKLDVFNLPNAAEPYRDITESLFIPYSFLESSQPDIQLMNPFSFYTYSGSETQPPCAERTVVYVNSKPINIGSVAIEMFKEAIKSPDIVTDTGETVKAMFPATNFRATQKLNGRAIFHYDHLAYCGPSVTNAALGIGVREKESKRRQNVQGHYEKKESASTEYFFVNGETPSGMPGAYVVSPKEAKQGLDF